MKNLKEKMYSWIVSEIQMAEISGIGISVDGEYFTSDKVDELHHMMEDSYYMKSYQGDDSGKITQISFDRIGSV